MTFAPADSPEERRHRVQLAAAVNAALRGETHNTGTMTVPAGATEYLLKDPRLGVEKMLSLTPLDAEAAQAGVWVDRSGLTRGSARLRFTRPPAAECGFDYSITGIQRLKA